MEWMGGSIDWLDKLRKGGGIIRLRYERARSRMLAIRLRLSDLLDCLFCMCACREVVFFRCYEIGRRGGLEHVSVA